MIYNPFPSFYDSYYFLTLPHNPLYFTYDPYVNSVKTSSNIILVKNDSKSGDETIAEQKCRERGIDQQKSLRSQRKQKQEITQKRQKRIKTQKQMQVKKQKKITKAPKKVDMVQKQGRNSHSNILRKFFKLLSLQSEFVPVVQKIIKKLGFGMKVEDYFNEVKVRNIDHRNYIRVKEVQCLFEYNQSPINKITRTLFQNYLKNYYVEHLLSSKKTDNKSIIFHLKGKRTICEQILCRKTPEEQNVPLKFYQDQ